MKSAPTNTPTNTIGELSLHFDGYGFVVPLKRGFPDVFIPARFVRDALHGDLVEVKVSPSKKGLWEGEITKVLERRLKQMVGRLELAGKHWTVVSEDQRIRHRMILKKTPQGVVPGEYVVAKILEYPSGKNPMAGEVIEKLPKRGSLPAEIDFVIAKHQWPKVFPKRILEEAQKWEEETAQNGIQSSENRKDLTALHFVTIDGEDAKDFDDAVYVERLSGDHLHVWVAIADVSYYVSPGSALDDEAYSRGTSVYFPGRVLPMLPEVLSNNLCSLRPHENRLTFVCELELGKNGEIIKEDFYLALIKSHARLTYQFVKRMLLDKEEGLVQENRGILPLLEILSDAARRLHDHRRERGSLDFDLPEPEIILDLTGAIENIEKSSRDWSHQIIEELMIAANESVARFLTRKKVGCLYRVHENPDQEKIRRFYKMIQLLGFQGHFTYPVSPKTLGKILKFFKGHVQERFVNSLLLRSLPQAIYSEHNMGHFGLGSPCYCHFTSPIRRYPDLVIHRLLRRALAGKENAGRSLSPALLGEIGGQTSRQERRALEAEREMLALHRTLFMQDKIGEICDGIVSHVSKFGFFVELIDYFVEGFVPKESLQGDHYIYDEDHLALKGKHKKKSFGIGTRVCISVEEVKLSERRTFFKLLDKS